MALRVSKSNFEKSGYYFIALLFIAFAGFWNSYFSKFFTGKNDFSFYFHFHAAMMLSWVALLIAQPILIYKMKLHLHRTLGKLTYFLMPTMLLSVLLLLHSSINTIPNDELTFSKVMLPVRDFLCLSTYFIIGVIYRRNVQIHARAMILTGIVFIEPALIRFLMVQFGFKGIIPGMLIILTLLTILILKERKQKSGRWLFPSFLVIDIVIYLIFLLRIPLTFLDPVVRWFAKLPLT